MHSKVKPMMLEEYVKYQLTHVGIQISSPQK